MIRKILPFWTERLIDGNSIRWSRKRAYKRQFHIKHSLKAASSVRTALTSLLKNDVVTRTEDGYVIDDYFFGVFLSRIGFFSR